MPDPSKRFLTIVLLLGIAVLVTAISFGEHAGDRVIGQVTEKRLEGIAPITVTPAPVQKSASPYGPNWKRTDVLSAAEDPGFPDPRVPPLPLPTPPPPPRIAPPIPRREVLPTPTATPNLNIPIWRRAAPLPIGSAAPSGTLQTPGSPSPGPSATSSPQP